MIKNEKFNIKGMTCAACQASITKAMQKLDGVQDVNVSLLSNQMTLSYDNKKINENDIISRVEKLGYKASLSQTEEIKSNDFESQWKKRKYNNKQEQKTMQLRTIFSIVLLIPLMYISMGHMLNLPVPKIFIGTENALNSAFTQLLITIPIVYINKKFYISGFKSLSNGSPNMDSLVAIGSSASLIYGIFAIYRMSYGLGHMNMAIVQHYSHELYFESCAMILGLVTLGKYLESRSKFKTSEALEKLVDLAPKTALVIRNGVEMSIPAKDVILGDTLIIKPGDHIPVDGIIIEGHGYIDQSAITGESIPVEKRIDEEVICATINKNGSFKMRASKVGNDTTLAQIIRLIDEAGNSKAPIARVADKISGIFVPIVITIALLTILIWLIIGQTFEFALSCGITVLVISCPCALGLATPVAIMAGTGKAAEYGILIKSAQSLENLHLVDTIALDKTGTITSGVPKVTDIITLDPSLNEERFLILAATLELGSEHPLALAVVEKAKSLKLSLKSASDFKIEAGRGVSASIDHDTYFAGNVAFMRENKVNLSNRVQNDIKNLSSEGKTPLIFARKDLIIGIIAVADTVKESSIHAIKHFRKLGLNVVMLTGDNKITAEAIRKKLEINEVISDVLPAEKEACVRRFQSEGHKIAMVGDGINDAPALTRADVGIAIGAGTDIAIESADIVLMKSSLNDVVTAIQLSKSVIKNIHMNLFWAFFYNILGIPIAAGLLYPAFGLLLTPMIGAAAMSLSSVFVVLNALRLRFFKENIITDSAIDKSNTKGNINMKKVITIEGMMCDHCKMRIEKTLSSIPGVTNVEVNLKNKKAFVYLTEEVSDNVFKDAISEAGYTVLNIKD